MSTQFNTLNKYQDSTGRNSTREANLVQYLIPKETIKRKEITYIAVWGL